MSLVSRLGPRIKTLLNRHGFDHYGWTPFERPLSFDVYRSWLDGGNHGSMHYLETHADLKANPQRLAPRARSAIVVAKHYHPHPYPNPTDRPFTPRTALYARGLDYHRSFQEELNLVALALRLDFVAEEFLCFTDATPILERDLGHRAGLGWVGKNTCLIDPKRGSLFLIGEIITSLACDDPAQTVNDHSGTCDRCLVACPTGALERPRHLNATKCIAYWTIEAREAAPVALSAKFGDWFFGCDICQTVCPWNQKAFGRDELSAIAQAKPKRQDLVDDLRWILSSSNRTLRRAFQNTALSHARPLTLKRNALNVIAAERLVELVEVVRASALNPALETVANQTYARLN